MMCDVLIEAEEFGQFKTFDLENVDLISGVGYTAAVRAFDKVVNEAKHDSLVKAFYASKSLLLPDRKL